MQQDLRKNRRFRRHILSVPVHVVREFPHRGETLPGLMMEISEGGFSTMLTDALRPGERVVAKFELPGSGYVSIEAVVRNKNQFRYGFEFVELDEKTWEKVKQACESLPRYEGGWY